MNFRVIGIVSIVVLFALASGYMSLSMSTGKKLSEVYNKENIQVIQLTSAGTVPHEVTVKNKGNDTVKVTQGEVLASSVSQDMVIAEDKTIEPNTEEQVKAYGLDPLKRANAGSRLLPINKTYDSITKVISLSDPSDSNNTLNTQLQIWIIMTEGNLNPYTGEPVAVVERSGLRWSQFRQDISEAEGDLMKTFNVTENEISNLKKKEIEQSWIDIASENINNLLGS